MSDVLFQLTEYPEEALYRGKRIDRDEWVYGGYAILRVPKVIDHHLIVPKRASSLYGIEVFPSTVGQYIRRKDKNGVDVFQGDIVKVHDSLNDFDFQGVVDFDLSSFNIVDGMGVQHYRWMDYDVEVIGNRIDDSELLEDEE